MTGYYDRFALVVLHLKAAIIWEECITNAFGGMIVLWPGDVIGHDPNQSLDLNIVPRGLDVIPMPPLIEILHVTHDYNERRTP